MSWQIKLLFLIVISFNLLTCTLLPLHPDEAYYWVWIHHLDLSYFDHPPLIAYLIKITTLLSEHIFFIRLTAISCLSLAAYFVYKLASELFNKELAEKAVLLFFCLPITLVAFWITTPDAPLMLFWSLTLFLFYRAINHHAAYFYGAGISAGLMLLAKYTGVLLLPALFLFLLVSPYRKQLLNKHLYFAFLFTILLFMPVIIWNSQHEWISFKFQFNHGMGETKLFNFKLLTTFLAGQAGIANPIFFTTLIFYSCKKIKLIWRDPKLLYIFLPFAFTLLFFTYAACFAKSEANWPVAAYISGCILLAYWWQTFNKKWLFIAGIVLSLMVLFVTRFPELFPTLPKTLVIQKQLLGYDEIFNAGNKYIDKETLILSDSHQHAAQASYYLKNKPPVYVLTPRRFSNYDYWRQDLVGKTFKKVIFFGSKEDRAELEKICEKVKLLDILRYNNVYIDREFAVYQCYGLKPVKP